MTDGVMFHPLVPDGPISLQLMTTIQVAAAIRRLEKKDKKYYKRLRKLHDQRNHHRMIYAQLFNIGVTDLDEFREKVDELLANINDHSNDDAIKRRRRANWAKYLAYKEVWEAIYPPQ